jgi:hypothetical protein
MINKIDKGRRRSMNVAPTRPSNKRQWQGAQEDLKQKLNSLKENSILQSKSFRWNEKHILA